MEHGGFRWGWGAGVILLILAIPLARRVVGRPMTTPAEASGILE
jgi:hypothetical protein